MTSAAGHTPPSQPPLAGRRDQRALTILKLGGSLTRSGAHGVLLDVVAELVNAGHDLVIVPGGGAFADTVRREYCGSVISAMAAHWMAVLAMDQMAYLLVGHAAQRSLRAPRRSDRTHVPTVPRSSPSECFDARDAQGDGSSNRGSRARVVRSAGGIARAIQRRQVPVLAPFRWLRACDPLPHSWTVTSDSIAAWVAAQLGARRLILLKSVDGIRDQSNALLPAVARAGIEATTGAATGVVDGYFCRALAAATECWIINGRRPERLRALVERDTTVGTIVNDANSPL